MIGWHFETIEITTEVDKVIYDINLSQNPTGRNCLYSIIGGSGNYLFRHINTINGKAFFDYVTEEGKVFIYIMYR